MQLETFHCTGFGLEGCPEQFHVGFDGVSAVYVEFARVDYEGGVEGG